jgi:hypothetical protein
MATLATHLSLMIEREDQKDWDKHLKLVQYAQLVGAQRVLGRFSPMFLEGGWEAMDPMDVAMGVGEQPKSRLLGEWMHGLAQARQIAMQAQASAVARDVKRLVLKAKELDVDVGDEVWVVFPNVGTGKSKKLAFKAHGPYILKEWLHGAKRVALLSHKAEPKDVIMAHVDRLVRKRDLPRRLREAWKPVRLLPVRGGDGAGGGGRSEGPAPEQAAGLRQAAQAAAPPAVAADKEVQREVERALEDEDFRIERILDHVEDDKGARMYKVRFLGYGPKDDLWYEDEDLARTAPEMLAEYEGELERKARELLARRGGVLGRTGRRRGGPA